MIICTPKFRMKCVIKGGVFFFLVFLPSVWWIYSKCVSSNLQDDKMSERQQMENYIRTKIEEDQATKIETIASDIEENKINPINFKNFPASIRKKRNVNLRQRHDDDQSYVKEPKEKVESKKIEEDTTSIETIANAIGENETYLSDIHNPASIQRNEKKLGQENKEDDECLKKLKEMLQGVEAFQLIKFEDDFLTSFIISSDYNIDEAFSKIRNFLNLRKDHDYFFRNISFDFTQNPAYRFVTILPHLRKDGSATILLELAKWDPDKVPLIHLKQVMFMITFQTLRNPVVQASGLNLIYDLADVGFRYIKFGTPHNLFLLQHVSFEVLPAKHLGYHVVNIGVIGNILITLVRPFIPKYIEKIFYTHSSAKNLLDFFPPSMLPVQYGGNLTEYYAADWIRIANQQHSNFPPGGQKNIF